MKSLFFASATAMFTLANTSALHAEQVFNEDVIVSGGLCAGDDCASGFGDGNGIRIRSDTPSVSFLQTDDPDIVWASWSMFGIDDRFALTMDQLREVFSVKKTATTNSLYLDHNGAGFGTSLPQRELHVIDANTPALRLEQSTGSGLEHHTWDISASNSGLIFTDVGVPFGFSPMVIENGAPSGSLHIDNATGNIGLRTTNPTAPLHVRRSNGSAKILVEETGGSGAQELFQMKSNGGSYFTLSNTASGRDWFFVHENAAAGRFIITAIDDPSGGMFLTPAGDMTIGGTLTTGGGTCGGGCDAVFSDDYALPSIAQHADAMWSLGHLPNVGPTPENTPINVSDKLGRMLNELEHAHIYIAQQQQEIAALKEDRGTWETRLAAIETELSEIQRSQSDAN